ncbi:MAG: SRPBCC family protein [Anaerolineae bacterium]|nr:SRPBCC family protein [Anaerolineales bacterium]MCQ3974852.1 SRPBCC family protein [Anaerolineae bacterium]
MTQLNVAVSAMINAPAQVVYIILSDYRHHHPHILPKDYFTGLEVEEGGQGEGTVFKSGMKIMGQAQPFRMRVTEPEPGRVLAETDLSNGLVTTFTVNPNGPERAEVTFATVWQPASGFRGWVERLTAPMFLKRVYRRELQILDAYARQTRNKLNEEKRSI